LRTEPEKLREYDKANFTQVGWGAIWGDCLWKPLKEEEGGMD